MGFEGTTQLTEIASKNGELDDKEDEEYRDIGEVGETR